MKFILLAAISLCPSVSLIKVLDFKASSEVVNVSLSRALLDNVPEEKLPRQLTVCTSHLQVGSGSPQTVCEDMQGRDEVQDKLLEFYYIYAFYLNLINFQPPIR